MIQLLTFLQVLTAIGLFLTWKWLKKLPDAIHKRQEQLFQQRLNREIEEFKTELARQLEQFKISQAQLQLRKTDEFIKFGDLFRSFLTDQNLKQKLDKQDPDAIKFVTEKFFELGVHIFFFASDQTIRKYVEWRRRSRRGEFKGTEPLQEFGELMIMFRRDLGYDTTKITSDDFLFLIVNDWKTEAERKNIQEPAMPARAEIH